MPVLNLRMQLKSIQLMKFHKHRELLNQNFNQQLHTDQNSMKVSLRQPTYQNKFIFIIFMIFLHFCIFFQLDQRSWDRSGRCAIVIQDMLTPFHIRNAFKINSHVDEMPSKYHIESFDSLIDCYSA